MHQQDSKMSVSEIVIIGTGAVIFNSTLEIPTKDNFMSWNPEDHHLPAYDSNYPVCFFFEQEVLYNRSSNDPILPVKPGGKMFIRKIGTDVYSKDLIIEAITERMIRSCEKEDDLHKVYDFTRELDDYLSHSFNVYFGKFIYRYFC